MTPGEAHEVKGYDALMELHDVDPDRLLGDKGYDSDEIRDDLTDRGIEPVIPPRSNRKTPIDYDREAYKRRNLIERCVNRLKQFRRIATRYEKTARAYLSMLCIASTMLWLKTVNTAYYGPRYYYPYRYYYGPVYYYYPYGYYWRRPVFYFGFGW